MIEEIFCELASKLKLSGYFDRFYEYVEIVSRSSNISKPMYYKGSKAGYVDIQNFDLNGTGYFRKRAQVGIRYNSNSIKLTACNDDKISNVVILIPSKLVVAIPKTKLEDSPFVDDILASNLITILQTNLNSLASQLNLISINNYVLNYETSPINIWYGENKGVELDENKLFKFSYIAIDFDIEVIGNVNCLQNCINDGYLA